MYRVRRMLPLHSSNRLAVASWSADCWRGCGCVELKTRRRSTVSPRSPSLPLPLPLPVTCLLHSASHPSCPGKRRAQLTRSGILCRTVDAPEPPQGANAVEAVRHWNRVRPLPACTLWPPLTLSGPPSTRRTAPVAPLSRLPSTPACCSLALVHLHDRSRSRHCWVRISSLFVPSGHC